MTAHVLTPTYRPVGGVVKLMDYVTHLRAGGHDVSMHCPEKLRRNLPIFTNERRQPLLDDPGVSFVSGGRIDVADDDLVLFSLPKDYEIISRSVRPTFRPHRIVHLLQNIRHTNPTWLGGFATRLLTRPMSRISINEVVAGVVEPYLDPRAQHHVINLGHECSYFATERRVRGPGPVRVAYTTWKSHVGDAVASAMDQDDVEFRSIRTHVGWRTLRDLYQWADVFLSFPGPEEGFYLAGLEAMAAGALVVTPDVGGNMAYCRPEENCLLVPFEDVDAYVAALRRLLVMDDGEAGRLRAAGYEVTHRFDLDTEREHLLAVVDGLDDERGEG